MKPKIFSTLKLKRPSTLALNKFLAVLCILLLFAYVTPQVYRVFAAGFTVSNVTFDPTTGLLDFDYTGDDLTNEQMVKITDANPQTKYYWSQQGGGTCTSSHCHIAITLNVTDNGVSTVFIYALLPGGVNEYSQSLTYPLPFPTTYTEQNSTAALTAGWVPAIQTWTYASSNSVTISGNQTATYTRGTRVKATNNSTTYYGTVANSSYSSPNTTVTFVANNDYSLANSAITNTYYSYEANPQGYPGTFNFTPTYTSGGGAFTNNPTTNFARFSIIGNKLFYWVDFTYNATSGGSGYTQITVPVAAKNPFETGSGQIINNAGGSTSAGLSVAADASGHIYLYKYDGTTAIVNGAELSVNENYSF